MNSYKNNMILFLKQFDVFGETHTFRVKTEKAYNSPVGGFLCLIFVFYTVYYTTYTFLDFINGNYKTQEYELKILPEPAVNMTDHKYFSIAFCIRDENYRIDNFLTKNLVQKMYYSSAKLTNDKILQNNIEEITMSNCADFDYTSNSLSNHQKKYWEILDNFQLSGCKCLNFDSLNEQKNFLFSSKLEGVIQNSFLMNLKFEKDENNIQSNLEMKDYITKTNPKMHIYFPHYAADLNSNEDPLQIKMHTESFELNPHFSHLSEISMGILSFTDYYSYTSDAVFHSKKKLIYNSRTNSRLNSLLEDSLLKVSFSLSGNNTTYKRNYLKLEDFLGNTIGYLWNIIFVVYLLSMIYNNFGSKRFLLEKFFLKNKLLKNIFKKEFSKNETYNKAILKRKRKKGRTQINSFGINLENIPDPNHDNLINNKNNKIKAENLSQNKQKNSRLESFQIQNENNLDLISNREVQSNKMDTDSNIIENDNNKLDIKFTNNDQQRDIRQISQTGDLKTKNNFSIYFYEYLYYLLCCSNKTSKTYELYKSTEYFYYYYMDVSNYLKFMVEFELIKSIVLSKNQRSLFKKFKPFLKLKYQNDYKEKLNDIYKEKFTDKDLNKLKNGIENANQNSENSFAEQLSKFI